VRANTIIAGVEKAGTTSLFVSLAGHPQVSPASVKETRYFSPLISGVEPEPVAVYDAYFAEAGDQPIRLEATPRYCTGGRAVAERIDTVCGPTTRVIVVLRDPVARFVSFFNFQKARLRVPEELSIGEYLARSKAMTDDDVRDASEHPWSAFRSGCYAEWLPAWRAVFGERLQVLYFDDLTATPDVVLRDVAAFLGIDPDGYASYDLASENRTTAYKRAGFQRVALALNDRLERFFRRHYKLKDRLRALYYRVNGRAGTSSAVPDAVHAELVAAYVEPNARLREQLEAIGVSRLPEWLDAERASA
jgi:hypothetical protein